jgi:hypothetical protein
MSSVSWITDVTVISCRIMALYPWTPTCSAIKNAELLEQVATFYYHALASGDEIQKLTSAAIDYFADMRRSRFK